MLARDEVRVFILIAVKEGIFADFFNSQEEKEHAAIDALFDEIFLDEFLQCDNDYLQKNNYIKVVQRKLGDDRQLQSQLIGLFDTIDQDARGAVNEPQVKKMLQKILRRQMKKITDVDSDDEEIFDGL